MIFEKMFMIKLVKDTVIRYFEFSTKSVVCSNIKRQSCTFTMWHGLSCKLQFVI